MVNRERLVQEFLEVVKINSQTRNERAMADFLKGKLTEIGLEVTEDRAGESVGGNAGNVVGVLGATADKPAIMFSAHMDRVNPGDNIQPRVEGDIIKSGGDTILGADDGAGLVGIMEMLRVVKENNVAHGPIEVVFTIAEEGGLNGSRNLDVEKLQAKRGVILDCSGDAGLVINQAPTQDEIVAKIHGRAAHAGAAPEKGINAIAVAAKAISRMQVGRIDEETTANVGVIQGGSAVNIVPDYVEVKCETRSLKEEKLVKATEAMVAAFVQAGAEANARVEMDVNRLYPAYHIPEDHEFLKLIKEAGQAVGLEVKLEAVGGGSDANIFNGKGIVAVNMAVGNEEVHTVQEYQKISELVKAVEMAVKIVELA
ncbi:M20/M25/M40 family metallo-hydrolase [Dethiobacter alkaliphilus]|uniref:M20/M25/M40 family metallo-hydrolase n=1 Tax=Dethiobacter alkaliphilus TaxID=427926 RepID=UPI0022277759|nr:M20/M25/M40 family metallo-hydrolase [Dethiobacter alkaliphilus]MCW3489913.1 M20/M25/M40 family metallo-hydrolase [Dethiobacter alkaliphilus]